MKTMQFKTNINCGGCLRGVTPVLDGQVKIERWEVDLQDPDRTLTVETASLSEEEIKHLLSEAGFTAEDK